MVVKVDEDEPIEHWTLVGDELGQVAGKRGVTRLGFSLLLKFYARHGRFPRGRGELPDVAVAMSLARWVFRPLTWVLRVGWSHGGVSPCSGPQVPRFPRVHGGVERAERYWRARLRQYQGARHRPVNERDGWLCLDDSDEYDFMACRWPVLSDDFVPGPPATGPGRLR